MIWDKNAYEMYAYLTVKYAFCPEIEMCHDDNPDWMDAEKGIGLEVTRAESQQIGNSIAFWNKNVGKDRAEISEKKLSERVETIYFNEDNKLKGMSLGGGLINGDSYIHMAVHSVVEKLDKLNAHYKECPAGYWLAIFLTNSYIDSDKCHLNLFIDHVKEIQNRSDYQRKFSKIFLISLSSNIYLIDTINWECEKRVLTSDEIKRIRTAAISFMDKMKQNRK